MNNWQGRAVLFLVMGVGCVFSWQYITSHFKSDRQIVLLNTTRPDFHRFLNLTAQPTAIFSRSSLREYFDYFQLVTQAMPDNSDGPLMLGYLDMITGDQAQAEVLLKESYRLDPQFFFTQFDLALVSFDKGDYAQSTDLLQKALAISPESTLNHMMLSIIYRQFFSSMSDGRDIIVDLRQAYQDAYLLLMESKQKESQGAGSGPQVHAHIM